MYKDKIVIGLVGETGSGKDTVAHYLKRRYDVDLLRFGKPLKKALDLFFEKSSKEDQAWLYESFKERFGEDVLHKGVLRYVQQHNGIMCVNGMRMMMDLEFIRSFENNYIMYVTADQELRWKRVTSRGEKSDDDQDLERFQKFETESKTEKAIPKIGEDADFVIKNDTSMDDLLWQVDDAMKDILKKRCD
ncbi:MAG: AAA family ATPase [Patescibacteria group bacterium]